MKKRLHNVALFGEMDDMLTFQWQHYHKLSDNVCKLRDTSLVKPQKIVEDVDVDEN
jgi:hypothetical protein